MLAATACSDLTQPNPNAPDLEGAVATPADAASLIGGSLKGWLFGTHSHYSAIFAISNMAFQPSEPFNHASELYSRIPRVAFLNTRTDANYDYMTRSWVYSYAALRAVARLGGRKVKTGEFPVLFEAPLAAGLLGSLVHAASGGALYRKSSFLVDHLGKRVMPEFINISERPHIKRGLGSSAFDSDGVATHDREVVSGGILQGYFLSAYTARKLGMQTTGNAGGSHNLIIEPGTLDRDGLLKQMNRGLLVTELLGHGINYVTGDYSRGAAGYWVENGRIAYPVEEITIAGNLKAMLLGIAAVGSDVQVLGSKQTGSILVDRMTVAGE